MDLGVFDLNTLSALLAVLQERNLTVAGAKVGMAQPAMSGVLGRYRRHFDDELLVRVGRDYELTPLARDLVPHLQEALHLMRSTLRVGEEFDPLTSDRLFTVTATDYAMTILLEPLRRLVRTRAPHVRLEFADLAEEPGEISRLLLRYDLLVAPRGYAIGGNYQFLFRDRLVCLVDPANPYLRDGTLDLTALREMPHAETVFRSQPGHIVERVLGQQGITRRVALQALGFLLLPFAIAGTEVVAIVPERLARRFLADGRLRMVELPFETTELLMETAWWHPSRVSDPGHRWLVGALAELAGELAADDPGEEDPLGEEGSGIAPIPESSGHTGEIRP